MANPQRECLLTLHNNRKYSLTLKNNVGVSNRQIPTVQSVYTCLFNEEEPFISLMKYIFFESVYLRILKDCLSELLKQLQEHLPVLSLCFKPFKLLMLTSWEVLWNMGRRSIWEKRHVAIIFIHIFAGFFFPLKELCWSKNISFELLRARINHINT